MFKFFVVFECLGRDFFLGFIFQNWMFLVVCFQGCDLRFYIEGCRFLEQGVFGYLIVDFFCFGFDVVGFLYRFQFYYGGGFSGGVQVFCGRENGSDVKVLYSYKVEEVG